MHTFHRHTAPFVKFDKANSVTNSSVSTIIIIIIIIYFLYSPHPNNSSGTLYNDLIE